MAMRSTRRPGFSLLTSLPPPAAVTAVPAISNTILVAHQLASSRPTPRETVTIAVSCLLDRTLHEAPHTVHHPVSGTTAIPGWPFNHNRA